MLEAGKIVNTHGLRGEVKLIAWTDYPEDFEDIEYVYVKRKTGNEILHISSIKYQKNNLIVKFSEIKDINEAEKYKNQIVYVERALDGDEIGIVADVFNTGANDIYDVKREGKKNLLIPVIDDVVKNIDVENKIITVEMMEGLDEL